MNYKVGDFVELITGQGNPWGYVIGHVGIITIVTGTIFGIHVPLVTTRKIETPVYFDHLQVKESDIYNFIYCNGVRGLNFMRTSNIKDLRISEMCYYQLEG